MKKFILTLIIAMLFIIPFAGTLGKLADDNSFMEITHELEPLSTSTFDVNNNVIDIDINGSQIDTDLIGLIPSIPLYTNDLTFMINGTLEGVADGYTRLQDPASLPSGIQYGAAFSPDSTKLVITFAVGPFIKIYDITTDPMTSYTTLDSYVSQPYRTAAYSPDGSRLVIGIGGTSGGSPYMTVYRTDTTPYTRLTDPENPAGIVLSIDFSPDGNYMAIGHTNSPYLTIYDVSSIPYTKVSNPATIPTGTIAKVKYSHNGDYLIAGQTTSPYAHVYDTSTIPYTYMTSMLDPAYGANLQGIAFTQNDEMLILGGQSQLAIYDTTVTPFYRLNTLTLDTGVLDLNHDESILAVKYASSGVRFYDMNSLFTLLTSPLDVSYSTMVANLQYSPDGNRFLVLNSSHATIFSLYDTNVKYFDVLDQDGNILFSLDYETAYVDEMVSVAVNDLEGISFRSQGVDTSVTSSLDIEVSFESMITENDSPMAVVIRFLPLLGFLAIATILIAYIMSKKR